MQPANVAPPDLPVAVPDEQPEHRGDRRRFLIWAVMLGAVPPERIVERIVAEVEREVLP